MKQTFLEISFVSCDLFVRQTSFNTLLEVIWCHIEVIWLSFNFEKKLCSVIKTYFRKLLYSKFNLNTRWDMLLHAFIEIRFHIQGIPIIQVIN